VGSGAGPRSQRRQRVCSCGGEPAGACRRLLEALQHHGNGETGSGYAEHAFAFDVSQRAAAVLRSAGVTVLLTRTDDVGVGPCVDARAAAANDVDADVAVSVHADGAAVDARGFHVIEPDVAPDGGNAAIVPASHEAAAMLRTAFAAVTGLGVVRCVT
jgi:hypothetical protein